MNFDYGTARTYKSRNRKYLGTEFASGTNIILSNKMFKKIIRWFKRQSKNEFMMAYYNTPKTYRRANVSNPASPGYRMIHYAKRNKE